MIPQMTNEQFALWTALKMPLHTRSYTEMAEEYYEWLESKNKTKTQDISAIEDKIKAIDKEIKQRETEIANAILKHKVWTGQIG